MDSVESFDPLRSRPNTPVKVVWYDFLLDESLLERHLALENPDPSPLLLVAEFVYQYQLSLQQIREKKASSLPPDHANSNALSNGTSISTNEDVLVEENRKCLALRLLALKVLAYHSWDLSFFQTHLPLPILHLLLTEFLRMAAVPDESLQGLRPSELDQTLLPDHTVFALILYHRWCLRTLVDTTLPKKPSKTSIVNVPGLQDPTVVPPGAMENTVKMVTEQTGEAVKVVEQFLQSSRSVVVVPNFTALGQLSEQSDNDKDSNDGKTPPPPSILLRWELGMQVAVEELVCQSAYDLGVYYFHVGDYEKAGFLLQTCGNLFSQVQDSSFCTRNCTDLDGYLQACSDVTGEKFASAPVKPTLAQRLADAHKDSFKDLPSILAEDNIRLQIPRTVREHYVRRHIGTMPVSLRRQVLLSNVLHRLMLGEEVTPDDLVEIRVFSKADAVTVIDALEFLAETPDESKKESLSFFVSLLLHCHVSAPLFKVFLESPVIQKLLGDDQILLIAKKSETISGSEDFELEQLTHNSRRLTNWPLDNDGAGGVKGRSGRGIPHDLITGSLEHRLINTRTPKDIYQILMTLGKMGYARVPILKIHQAWDSLALKQTIAGCLPDKFDQEYVTILFTKAFQCRQMKAFEDARCLLQAAMTHSGNLPQGGKRIAAIANWESLLVSLLQYRETDTVSVSSGLTASDLINRVKNCLSCLDAKPTANTIAPSMEVVEKSVTFLINIKDWSTLWGPQHQHNGQLELGRLLCNCCKELPNIQAARKAAKDLFDGVLSIFLPSGFQQKRGPGGTPVGPPHQRESGLLPRQLFLNFVESLKEPVVLTTIISLLAKIFNVLKDDSGKEVHGEYFDVWPATTSTTAEVASVTETLEFAVSHALASDATNASWILTQADIHFARGQHATAMQHYVEAGFVSSAAFSKPVPKEVFCDSVLRRMIKCCSSLKCHTQVVLLCQFLDETDYVIAFKALQEKQVVADAMDNYYDCIWDTTVLEYLANLHIRRGELQKHQLVLQAFGHLDLNPNNAEDVVERAIQSRKSKFMRALSRQYMLS